MLIDITDSGIVATNRNAILEYLIQTFKSVYGENIYLQEGTEDYNMLSSLADLFNDMGMVAVSVGNGFNLQTATGFQLDNIATIFYNTINRTPATYSTVEVVITGTPNTNIASGQIRDELGGIWNLPTQVTLPASGSTTVTATYQEAGAYFITAGQISGFNSIVTPVAGWTNVTNLVDSVAGQEVETDAQFRYRLAVKAQGNSKSVLNSLYTNLTGNDNIYNAMLWENDTSGGKSFTDVGLLNVTSHSIVIAVYGDFTNVTDEQIAQIIYDYKGTGVGTYAPIGVTGSTMVNIVNQFNTPQPISFVKAEVAQIPVNITLQKISGNVPDVSVELVNAIKNSVIMYIQSQEIGSLVYANGLFLSVSNAILNTVGPNVYNIGNINFGTDISSKQMLYYQKPYTQDSIITVTT